MDYDSDTSTLSIEEVTAGAIITLRLYDIFIPLLGIFIILLNLLVVISSGLLLEKRQQPRCCYIFLGNMGLSNLLTGIAVLFGHFYPNRNDTSCAIQTGMIVSSTLVSVFSVMLVAIDRYLYISDGLRYQQYMFPNRVRILIVISWMIGLLFGFLPVIAPSLRGNMTDDQCWFILVNAELILATTIIGIVPVFVVVVLYSIILHKALKKVGEMKRATSVVNAANGIETGDRNTLRYFRGSASDLRQTSDRDQDTTNITPLRHPSKSTSLRRKFCCLRWRWCCCSQTENTATTAVSEGIVLTTSTPRRKPPSKWKAIKVVLFTTGSFVITWLPYFIASTMYVYCDQETNPNLCNGLKFAVASPLAILGFSNSLLNPIIYAWWHTGFRTNAIRIYAKRFERIKWCRWCFNKSNGIASSHTTSLSVRTTNLSSTSTSSSSGTRNSAKTIASTTTTTSTSRNVNENEMAIVSPHVNESNTVTEATAAAVEEECYSTNL